MSTLRVGAIAGVVAIVLLLPGMWILNNTRFGLEIKCQVLGDLGACLMYGLTSPGTTGAPETVEDPAVAAARGEEADANAAVKAASDALGLAVNALAYAADGASAEAADLSGPLADLSWAVDDERATAVALNDLISAGSTGDFWVDEVSFALYEVEFARNSVDFARYAVDFASYSIDAAGQNRQQLERDIQSAIERLERALIQYPSADAPAYTTSAAQSELRSGLVAIDAAVATYEERLQEANALVTEAAGILVDATTLAATVGAS